MMAAILRSPRFHLPVLCSSSPSPLSHSLRSPSRSVQTLAYEEIRTSEKHYDSTALVIHGVLGSSQYLKPFSGELLSELQKSSRSNVWRIVLVDLRNHGRSADLKGFEPPHDMFNAANDLSNLVKCHGWAWPDVVIGHSMGGKVGLEFISSCARGDYGESALLPKQLWVLDAFLGEINSSAEIRELEKFLHAMQSLPSSLPSQKWFVDQMIKQGFSMPISEWLGSNLKKSGEHYTWAFNLQAVIDMLNSYKETTYWSLLEHPPKGLKIDIVRAENNENWKEHILEKLAVLTSKEEQPDEGKVSVHVLPNSGHWVQADNPKGLLEIMSSNFFSKD